MTKTTKPQHVYMLQLREFIRINESTYKIGKTKRTPNERFNGYPKGSRVIQICEVRDCHLVEQEIIRKFTKRFLRKTEYGSEYFQGEEEDITEAFNKIVERFGKLSGEPVELDTTTVNEQDISQNIAQDIPQPVQPIIDMVIVPDNTNNQQDAVNTPIVVNTPEPDGNYMCYRCETRFTKLSALRQHIAKATVPCDLYCNRCAEKLPNRKAYDKHIERDNCEPKFIRKRTNDTRPDSTNTLEQQRSPKKTPVEYQCTKCNDTFPSLQFLIRHQEKSIPCDFLCTLCGTQFSNSKADSRHRPCRPPVREV